MVSRDEIRWAYRALLGREPEGETAYLHHSTHENFDNLRHAIITSEEGIATLRKKMMHTIDALPFDYFRPVTVFIHIQKTGGTAIHEWLCNALGSLATSDAHTGYLPKYTLGELNQLDLVSGHLTYQEALALPRETKRLICSFREPRARLISLYRFYRAHDNRPGAHYLTQLAHALSAEEFFAHHTIRTSHEIDNRYRRVFCEGGSPPDGQSRSGQGDMNLALSRLYQISAVIIMEQMERSVSSIIRKLGTKPVPPPRHLQVTDELYRHSGFRKTEPIVLTSKLQALLAPLVEHDLRIYEHACRILHSQGPGINPSAIRG